MILDGEAVVLDEQGRSDYPALLRVLGGRGGKRIAPEVMFYAFDLLYLDGQDLRSGTLDVRRAALGTLLHGSDRPAGSYRSSRGTDWLKVKCIKSEGFVIVGYEPSAVARGGLGRLLLACRQGGDLVHAGSVGTGFSEPVARALRKILDAIRRDTPAIALKEKRIVWVDPVLVAEIEFRGWTGDGVLRHASYKGLREGADAADIFTRLTGRTANQSA